MSNERQRIRQQSRARRKSLSANEQREAAHAVLHQCVDHGLISPGLKVAVYLAADGELDTTPLIQYCWENQIETYLPVLHPFGPGHLLFLRYQKGTAMQANRFGIAEPKLTCPGICPLPDLDVLFTPLVAFDKTGNRMGMGGGFYDRTLAPIERDGLNTHIFGLAHQCQQFDQLPTENWDIPLRKIVTPAEVFSN